MRVNAAPPAPIKDTERPASPDAAPSPGASSLMPHPSSLHLHLGSIILSGDADTGFADWPAGSRARLENALNAELTRLLTADPDAARRLAVAGNAAVPLLSAPAFTAADGPESCGQRLAATLLAALTGAIPAVPLKGETS